MKAGWLHTVMHTELGFSKLVIARSTSYSNSGSFSRSSMFLEAGLVDIVNSGQLYERKVSSGS